MQERERDREQTAETISSLSLYYLLLFTYHFSHHPNHHSPLLFSAPLSLSKTNQIHTFSLYLSSATMTDTTDDIAEEISFQAFDDDCKLLGNLLNDILQREVGTEFMEKFERTRILAQVSLSLPLSFSPCYLRFLRFCCRFENSFDLSLFHTFPLLVIMQSCFCMFEFLFGFFVIVFG